MKYLKNYLRPGRDAIFVFFGFIYDYYRFLRYAGWRGHGRVDVRDYKAVKIYHRLEKSMSFRTRRPGAGFGAASDLYELMRKRKSVAPYRFHERVALGVLDKYLRSTNLGESRVSLEMSDLLVRSAPHKLDDGGSLVISSAKLTEGVLSDPERFFLSRYSVRDFSTREVDPALIERALNLALKTPSVCNRQAWHLYQVHSREVIAGALRHQNGNVGFGHEVPCLLIITSDLRAFDTSVERYQHWIDGGMFSMSMVLALHSLGVASCCLNWSKGMLDDLRLRKIVPIQPEHTVVMMIAVGYSRDELNVCSSARKPVVEFFTNL